MSVRDWSHAEIALELPKVFEQVADSCQTDLGTAALESVRPSFDGEMIRQRVRQTVEALNLISGTPTPIFSNARDVRAPVAAAGKGSLLPGEVLFRVGETLGAAARLRQWLAAEKTTSPSLWLLGDLLPCLPKVREQLERSVGPDGEVLDTASPALKFLRSQKLTQSRRIVEKIQSLISGPLKNYLQEAIYTQRDGRYVVPVKAQYRGKVPGIVHDASGSGQTIFVEPEPVVGAMNKLREIEAAESEEVERILAELSEAIGEHADEIVSGLAALAELDAIIAKARYAIIAGASEPTISQGCFLRIVDGHHPLLDRKMSVPLTVSVGGNHKSLLITGPNTGGKTVSLKTVGLYPAMLGCGMLPPARKVEYGPFTGVWADIGDEQSLQQSLSTFSGHLKNVARVFEQAKEGALAIFDEIGAGTDPSEGAALGKAILSTLAERGITVAASTHYGELKEFALQHPAYVSAAMEFDMKTLSPTYHLIPGAAGASHGFEISRRYGLPDSVVGLAEDMLGAEAKDERSKTRKLDEMLSQARDDRAEAEEIKRQLQADIRGLEKERSEMKERLSKARERAEEAIADAVREARENYRVLLELASDKKLTGRDREVLLQEAKKTEDSLRQLSEAVAPHEVPRNTASLIAGMDVTVRGHPQIGKVLEVQKSGNVVVQINNLKMTLKPEDVTPAKRAVERPTRTRTAKMAMERSMIATSELMLRHMNVEQAQEALEKFFDDASLAGLHRARLVHGKGDGILRRVVRTFLSKRKDVKSIAEPGPAGGGSGVTEVEFK